MSHSATITSYQINLSGGYDANSNFVVSQNEIRARYVSNADSRFGGGAGLQLPKLGDDGQVIVSAIQLTPEQVTQIENVLRDAMTATQYGGCDFGPSPAPPAAE